MAVVVGTCPDLGTIRPIPQPLKQVAREWSRRLAAAQTITVVENGGRSVSLGDILGPEFDAAPALLFGPDRFHPSADGYKQLASVLIPSCLAALDLLPDDEALPEPRRREGILPVAAAAVRAARTPGTEVDGTEVGGTQRGLRGRWVELRHRRRRPSTDAESPGEHEDAVEDPRPTRLPLAVPERHSQPAERGWATAPTCRRPARAELERAGGVDQLIGWISRRA